MAWIIALLLPILLFLIAWFVLAKNDWFFTFVREGTAKAVMNAEAFERIVFRWKGHFMDEEDNIWEEEDWEAANEHGLRKGKEKTGFAEKTVKEKKVEGRIFGGLFWIGLPPFKTIHKYPLRWTDFRQTEIDGKTVLKLQFHDEEDRDFVMLKPAVYGIEVEEIETRPPERIRVTPQIPITMRVVNARLFLFVAPPTPLEDILVRMSALMRQRISMSTVDEIIALHGQAEKIWEGWDVVKEARKILKATKVAGVKDEKLIKDTSPRCGLRVAEKGIEVKGLKTPPGIQEAMEERKKQDMLAEARAGTTMGSLISSEAVARGKSKEAIQREIDQDPDRREKVWQDAKEMILKKLAMESGGYVHGEFPQGSTLETLITLAKRMPMGPLGESPAKELAKGEEKKSEENPAYPILSTLPSNLPKKLTKKDMKELKEELDKLPEEERDKWLKWIAWATANRQITTGK